MPVKKITINDYKKRVCNAMNYISHNLDKNLGCEEIARHAAFSPYHFHRIFKAVTGETIAEFTRRLRLEIAANRLKIELKDDITSLALELGFSSSQNFATAFKKHFGISPTQFKISKNSNKISSNSEELSIQISYTDSMFDDQLYSERIEKMNVEIKELPAYRVAYIRKIGAYCKETCEQAFGELVNWAGPKGYFSNGLVIGVYWDNPEITPPERCRIDACITISDDTKINSDNTSINIQTLHGGSYAIFSLEVTEFEFKEAWNNAFKWFISHGYECSDQPCFEIYHNDPKDHPENKFVVDICIPIK